MSKPTMLKRAKVVRSQEFADWLHAVRKHPCPSCRGRRVPCDTCKGTRVDPEHYAMSEEE